MKGFCLLVLSAFDLLKSKYFLIETDNDRKLTTPYPNKDYECEENYESDSHYSDIRSKEYKWEVVYKNTYCVSAYRYRNHAQIYPSRTTCTILFTKKCSTFSCEIELRIMARRTKTQNQFT